VSAQLAAPLKGLSSMELVTDMFRNIWRIRNENFKKCAALRRVCLFGCRNQRSGELIHYHQSSSSLLAKQPF
jgi:hypothetical protein